MRIKSSTPALRKTRRFTSTCTTITMTSSPRCLGFFARNYYCHACKKVYEHLENHVCPNECKCCGFFPEESWRSCRNCRRQFKSQQCYDQHKQSRGGARPICARLIKCTKCGQHVPRYKQVPEKHRCEQKKCGICGK